MIYTKTSQKRTGPRPSTRPGTCTTTPTTRTRRGTGRPWRRPGDWARAFHSQPSPTSFYEGQAVDVIGFVVRQKALPAGQFALARLVMRHCAADTYALGLLVIAPGTDGIADQTWVHVTGTL